MIDERAIADLKDRNPVDAVARQWVALRRHGTGFIGPCPICSHNPHGADATRFECDAEGWVCAVCADGGDVIKLVMLHEERDFLGAVEWLGGAREVDPAVAARRERGRAQKREKAEREAVHYRERDRRETFRIWREASPVAGSPAEHYLMRRGLTVPPGARLRCVCAKPMPYYLRMGKDPVVLTRAPAMVAPIIGADGKFSGLHFTYLDATTASGKLAPVHPDTGEALPAKKVRGSKGSGAIHLVPKSVPRRLIIGEGIETVLSVWLALWRLGRDLPTHPSTSAVRDGCVNDLEQTAFWSAIDLGHLGGKAAGTVSHPTLRAAHGRAQRVPGPEPDLAAPGIAIPDSVEDIVLLGDGDSDRFLTECALVRAAARFARAGRTVRAAWAPSGRDFNDLIREAA
jgi:hypothetical protein